MRIACPWCGTRDVDEFVYGGDASGTRPPHACDEPAAWHDHLYPRDNPKGRHVERWQHERGCREWLVVERDTLTHEIRTVRLARAPALDPVGRESTP